MRLFNKSKLLIEFWKRSDCKMGKNEFGIILPTALGYEINIALLKGDTKTLFTRLVSYMEHNDLNRQDAASILLDPQENTDE